jgi:hypothetical protein
MRTLRMSFSYATGEIRSFVGVTGGPYIACMKNRYPTPAELYALEQNARRLRAAEMGRLFKAGADAVRALFTRAPMDRNVKGLRHA